MRIKKQSIEDLKKQLEVGNRSFCDICFSRQLVKDLQFENVDFSGANFFKTKFENCQFENVKFSAANLKKSHFFKCNFKNVNFEFISAQGISFSESELNNVDMRNAYLDSSSFSASKVVDVRFCGSDFNYSNIFKTSFSKCNFRGSKMEALSIKHVEFNEADFSAVNFTDSEFKKAIVKASCFSSVNCSDVVFKDIEFSDNSFFKADFRASHGLKDILKKQVCDAGGLISESYFKNIFKANNAKKTYLALSVLCVGVTALLIFSPLSLSVDKIISMFPSIEANDESIDNLQDEFVFEDQSALEKAWKYWEEGDLEKAKESLEDVLKNSSSQANIILACTDLVDLLCSEKAFIDAEFVCDDLIEKSSDDFFTNRIKLIKVNVFLASGLISDAEEVISDVKSVLIDDAGFHEVSARLNIALEKFDIAVEEYLKVLTFIPETNEYCGEIKFALAETYELMDNSEKAVEIYKELAGNQDFGFSSEAASKKLDSF